MQVALSKVRKKCLFGPAPLLPLGVTKNPLLKAREPPSSPASRWIWVGVEFDAKIFKRLSKSIFKGFEAVPAMKKVCASVLRKKKKRPGGLGGQVAIRVASFYKANLGPRS